MVEIKILAWVCEEQLNQELTQHSLMNEKIWSLWKEGKTGEILWARIQVYLILIRLSMCLLGAVTRTDAKREYLCPT